MASKKQRLDTILVEMGLFESKNKAQAAILAGDVKVNSEKITKAGYQLVYDENLDVSVKSMPYVSRGGFKLEKALKEFNLSVEGKICIDGGASTGGFTDCLLQNGAEKVYAIDVGYGQLAWKIRNNPKVATLERMNIRNCTPEEVYSENTKKASFACMDLSFISITKVLSNIKTLLRPENIEVVTLIKPQFEAGVEFIQKNGVVKEKSVHCKIIHEIFDFVPCLGLYPMNLTFSPVTGPAGNIEFLTYFTDTQNSFDYNEIEKTVNAAHEQFFNN